MNEKIPVGILGATGMVGQNYVSLLENHPWFEVTFLAASEHSAGQEYASAIKKRWRMPGKPPEAVGKLPVFNVKDTASAQKKCRLVFSAFSMSKNETLQLEREYAAAGMAVISNNSAHRLKDNVPIIMPEVNPELLEIIPGQQQKEGWNKGFIVTKPNCGVQSYVLPVAALKKSGLKIDQIITTNLQALSGAGYPGQSALDVLDNLIPLPSEEEKAFNEPQKIFGKLEGDRIVSDQNLKISSNCVRVPVIDGHSSCVWFSVQGAQPEIAEIEDIFRNFRGVPQEQNLPSAPQPVLRYTRDPSHPQPRLDRNAGNGMAVTIGRLQKAPVLGYRFTALSHNTLRGAAGGAILTAELLVSRGYVA